VLKANPTDWLLELEDAGVRYLALRDLTGAGEKEVKAARGKAHREGPIAVILDNMNPEGYWVNPGPGYLPKFKSIVWSLITLAQLGASIEEDKRIGTAVSYYLDNALVQGGQFTPNGRVTDIGLCLQGNMLVSLLDLGCRDNRLDNAYRWTARRITGDNLPRKINDNGLTPADGVSGPFRNVKFITNPLFGCRTNEGLACAWAGVNVMLAFSRLPLEHRTDLEKQAIEAGVDFFLNNNPAAAGFPGHRKGTPDPRWWHFVFPSFAGDMLRIAEAFTALGYGSDPRLAGTLDIIRQKQDEKGRWLYEYPNTMKSKMWYKFGEFGQPNKWITLKAMRVLRKADE
jgi:hypothetical protein